MPRSDPARLQRAREKKEAKKREKDNKASNALTEAGRTVLELVLDGGRGSAPATNLPKALKEFDAALELKPDNADALYFRGRCQQELAMDVTGGRVQVASTRRSPTSRSAWPCSRRTCPR